MEEKNKESTGVSQKTLCWTNNRTFQRIRDPEQEKIKREIQKDKIVKIKKNPPFFCRKNPIILLNLKNNKLVNIIKNSLRCKSWDCPYCAPLNAVEAYFKIRSTAVLNNLSYFLTLTLDPKKIPPEYFKNGLNKTHKYITYLFNRLATTIRRQNKDLRYIWVIQFHKKGNAHLHILLNTRLDILFVREEWTRIGGGIQMRVEEVGNMERVSSYVSNYISKGFNEISTGKIGFFHWEKRYSISHSCIRTKKTYEKLSNYPKVYEDASQLIKMALINEDGKIYPKPI